MHERIFRKDWHPLKINNDPVSRLKKSQRLPKRLNSRLDTTCIDNKPLGTNCIIQNKKRWPRLKARNNSERVPIENLIGSIKPGILVNQWNVRAVAIAYNRFILSD